MHPMLTIAVKAARRAASVIQRASNNLDILRPEQKRPNDFVSGLTARPSKRSSTPCVRPAGSRHSSRGPAPPGWGSLNMRIIDPLDGTTNYLHGYPQYCVSIALSVRGALTLGVIYDPCRNDLFTACRGSGAFLNDRRIRVGKRTMLADCLVATGHPHVNTENSTWTWRN